ncbi:MAG TPA: alpha/beta fold hydrolase [Candidatus Omnitrophota bacterium]|nr:alpha/beta fold hydrolase [Candidatus Omnitrophota bacterium]
MTLARLALAVSLGAGLARAASPAAHAAPAAAPATAFLTYESGVLVGVDWVDRAGSEVHTRSVLMQSSIIDATVTMREDGTAARSSTVLQAAGSAPRDPMSRTFPEGTIYWSDMTPASIEEAIQRARFLGQDAIRLPASSLFRDSRDEVEVARVDSTDWVVRCHGKRYEVLTDREGRMLSATLPEYGVTIERRDGFRADQYPLWNPNGAPPDGAYRAADVSIRAPQGHVLTGTLTMPPGRGPFPAAVLITGLSPNNRNEGDPPWMALRDIADALTRRGIAVLRVDDRGVGASTGDRASSTTLDEAADVRTEIAWLRSRPKIRRERVALVGYSEGGLIAPMVASDDPSVAAVVTLAGPGVSGAEVARYQITAAVTRDTTIAPADREAAVQRELNDTLTVRERSYLAIDPIAYARRVRCPALIVQGGNDQHIPVRSAERLAWAMRASGNRDVTVRIVPGVSHSLLPDVNGLSSGWVYLPAFGTSPEILRTVGEWLSARLTALNSASPSGAARPARG